VCVCVCESECVSECVGVCVCVCVGSQELNTTEMLRTLLRKGCQFKHQEACKHLEVATCLLLLEPCSLSCLAPKSATY